MPKDTINYQPVKTDDAKTMDEFSKKFVMVVEPGKKVTAEQSFLGNEYACYAISEELNVKLARPVTLTLDGILYKYTRISYVGRLKSFVSFRESKP